MNFKSVFITGGAGYVGSSLVPDLLKKNFKVAGYDTMYFGNSFFPKNHSNLKIIQGDIRDQNKLKNACEGYDVFINLACISNDSSFELNEELSTSVNFDAFEPMVISAKKAGIKRFIYASTSSVYGVSKEKNVTEEHPLVPLTLYNKFKGMCEPLLFKHTDKNFVGVVFRPATVCGYAPRQRLDVPVNILTNYAVNKNEIKVFGGKQLRPNLHIKDYCKAVEILLNAEKNKIENQIFNIGYQNMSINEIAKLVKDVVEKEYLNKGQINIVKSSSDDNRSYHINSEKIKKVLGFEPKKSIEMAIKDLCDAFKQKKIINSFENDLYFNVSRLKNIKAK